MEPGGLLLYNGRLNERHDFLAVEIIQGQVQLKYSTGRLGTTYCGIWAMGAAKRGVPAAVGHLELHLLPGHGLIWR